MITIKYFVDQNDCLEFQLYLASKSERIQKKRKKSKIIIPATYLAISCLFYLLDMKSGAAGCIVFAALWFFIYPIWLSNKYINHYKDFVKEKWTESSSESKIIKFDEESIYINSDSGDCRLNITEIKEIAETPKLILIKFKSGGNIMLPKLKISNIDDSKEHIKILASKLNVNYIDDINWVWK